jgi:hypothetical protein
MRVVVIYEDYPDHEVCGNDGKDIHTSSLAWINFASTAES